MIAVRNQQKISTQASEDSYCKPVMLKFLKNHHSLFDLHMYIQFKRFKLKCFVNILKI